jgi:hypothetical protein
MLQTFFEEFRDCLLDDIDFRLKEEFERLEDLSIKHVDDQCLVIGNVGTYYIPITMARSLCFLKAEMCCICAMIMRQKKL